MFVTAIRNKRKWNKKRPTKEFVVLQEKALKPFKKKVNYMFTHTHYIKTLPHVYRW